MEFELRVKLSGLDLRFDLAALDLKLIARPKARSRTFSLAFPIINSDRPTLAILN